MGGYVMGGCVSLFFFQLQKREINVKRGICAKRDVRKEGLVIIRDEAWWWGVGGQKRVILAWRNYWTVPKFFIKKKIIIKGGGFSDRPIECNFVLNIAINY